MGNTDGLWRGGSPGRPAGTPNKHTARLREQLQDLVLRGIESPEFQRNLVAGIMDLSIDPKLLALVLAYGFGKPSPSPEARGDSGFEDLLRAIVGVPARRPEEADRAIN